VLHDIHDRALRRAAKILGGEEKLIAWLGVSGDDFTSLTSQKELPRPVFLRLVDLITEEDVRFVRARVSRR
jgi:hypothetical protein